MAKKNRQRGIPSDVTKLNTTQANTGQLSNIDAGHLGLAVDQPGAPFVVLKYYQPNYQCFSAWEPTELKMFSAFIRKLSSQTWNDIQHSGGASGNKQGLGYTRHKSRDLLPTIPSALSEDITFFELRVTQKARVHGFRVKSAFFLVWLDRNHEIYRS